MIDNDTAGLERLPHSAGEESSMMEIRNLAKNILYRICTELVHRDQCKALEMDTIRRLFPDIPSDNINASVCWLVDRGWLRTKENRTRVHLTESGRSAMDTWVPSALQQDCFKPERCHRQRWPHKGGLR
jgi:hypothetical protein